MSSVHIEKRHVERNKLDGIRRDVVEGSAITGMVTILMRVINFVAALYLLRILDPNDFGVVALAMLLVSAVNLFSDLGMGPALIHSRHDRKTAAFQAFVTSFIFSSCLSLLIYFNAQLLADLLRAPQVLPIVEVMSLYIVIGTLSTIPFCMLRKDMLFKRVGQITFWSEITITMVQLLLAFLGFGLWSLVIGRIAGVVVRAIAAWSLCPGWDWITPGRWDWKVHGDLLGFGVQATGSSALSYCYSNFDDWIIGRVLGTTALGYYSKAYDFTHTTTNRISRNIIATVFFPAFAKIRDDKLRLIGAYIKSVNFLLIVMAPLAFGTMTLATDFVRILFGDKWLPMVPVMQVYAFVILTRPVSTNSASLFQALGKPSYNFRAGLLVLFLVVSLSLCFVSGGIIGVAIAVAVAHYSGMVFNVYQANQLLPGTLQQSLRLMPLTFMSGALMAAVVAAAKYGLSGNGTEQIGIVSLVSLTLLGAIFYGFAIFITQRAFLKELTALLGSSLPARLKGIIHRKSK